MNKSMYFLVPAIIGVVALIGYSVMDRSSSSVNADGHTAEDHAALLPATTVAHNDSGKAAHSHD